MEQEPENSLLPNHRSRRDPNMRTQPIQWFFNRLGMGMALSQDKAVSFRRNPANLPLEEELLFKYLGETHGRRR